MNIGQYLEASEPVEWHQGMLLSPQHFQQQEQHIERLTTQKLFVSQPHYWGLIDIEVDRNDLTQGRISISRLHAVFPDGEVINFHQDETEGPLEASISEEELGDMEPGEHITVSIGSVRRGVGGVGAQRRYESIGYEDVTDENNQDQKVDLTKKRLALRIFTTNRVPNRYVSLPLFRLARRQDNSFELTGYHPPMLNARVSQNLLGKGSIWSRVEKLAADLREKAAGLAATQTSSFSDRATIAALIGRLPPLEVLLNTRMTHPFTLYMAFVDVLAGFLTLEYFQDFFEPRGYDHDNPAPAFTEHLDKIGQQLARIQLAFESIPFVEVEDGVFQLDLPEGADINKLVVAIIPRDGQDPRIATSWINEAVVGSVGAFENFRRQRVLGAARRAMAGQERVENRLPLRGNIMVLSNETYDFNGSRYDSIESGQRICIQGKKEKGPAAIYLYIQQEPGAADRRVLISG